MNRLAQGAEHAHLLPWPPPQLARRSPARRRPRPAPPAALNGDRRPAQPDLAAPKETPPPLRRIRQAGVRTQGPGARIAAEGIARIDSGTVLLTREQVTAWYVLPLQQWSFRAPSERTALAEALTARLSQFAGRRIWLRITSRPYAAWQWAADLDASIRGQHPVLSGPCAAHPHRSQPGCPSCRPGHAWLDWLAEEQRRIRQWGTSERVAFLGVHVTDRGGLTRMLGRAWDRAASHELSGLSSAVAQISDVAAGPGLYGTPASAAELRWLITRSLGLHLAAPASMAEDPQPVPYALPAAAPACLDAADLGEMADSFRWTARPFGRTVLISRADGLARHVAVLTVGPMTGQDDADPSPWIQRTDHLPFPVEWMITADMRRRDDVAKEMSRLIDRIRHQHHHITVEHGQPAPPAMGRQMRTAQRIEDQSHDGTAALASRARAWIRIAVGGDTDEEALARARQVAELYAPGITIVHSPGQYCLAREMIPGEPLADFGHRRSIETALLAAGMPTASAAVGHRHGFPLGVTTSMARRAVTLHPWHGMEQLNHSGLITITGTLGGGKSNLAGLLIYMAARAGITTVALDPSGMLDRLCAVPVLAGVSLAVNLLESPPGTLNPYRLIPGPAPDTPPAAREQRERSAAVARRALVGDILKMLLPSRVQGDATEFAINEAVRAAPATESSCPQQVIAELRRLDSPSLADRGPLLAGILDGLAEHELARLFFPAGDADPSATIGRGRVLTIMTLRGLVLPGDALRPEERTTEQQLSIPVVHLAAQLLRRLLLDLPRAARKMAVLDEAHVITSDATGRKAVAEMARDSRKNNACVIDVSQNPADLLAAGIANLVGTVFAFRTEGQTEQAATLDLLGLPLGAGHEQRLASLSSAARAGSGLTGECLMRDGNGAVEQVQIDLGGDPALRAALDSTPGARRWKARGYPALAEREAGAP